MSLTTWLRRATSVYVSDETAARQWEGSRWDCAMGGDPLQLLGDGTKSKVASDVRGRLSFADNHGGRLELLS